MKQGQCRKIRWGSTKPARKATELGVKEYITWIDRWAVGRSVANQHAFPLTFRHLTALRHTLPDSTATRRLHEGLLVAGEWPHLVCWAVTGRSYGPAAVCSCRPTSDVLSVFASSLLTFRAAQSRASSALLNWFFPPRWQYGVISNLDSCKDALDQPDSSVVHLF